MTYTEMLNDTLNRIEELKRTTAEPLRQAFLAGLSLAWDDTAKEIMWEQYTPHFNDGDECVFQPYLRWSFETTTHEEVAKAHPDILRYLNSIPTAGYLAMFGDHVEVRVRRNDDGTLSVKTTTCRHD